MENNPIVLWRDLRKKSFGREEVKKELREIFLKFPPKYAEVLVNAHCPNRCEHCMYSPNFAKFHKSLSEEDWKRIFDYLCAEQGFEHFVFGGRTFDRKLASLIKYLNKKYPSVKVSLIADGPSIEKYYNELSELKLNNLDISMDGLEKTHDEQRNYPGSFEISCEQIKRLISKGGLVDGGNIKKLSILATLTTINQTEIIDMIKFFNEKFGLKNFFVTPENVCEEANFPRKELQLSDDELLKFIKDLGKAYRNLKDSYVVFNMYDENFIDVIEKEFPEIYYGLKPNFDYLDYSETSGDNEFHISIFPISINGCREFIVNSDGILFPGIVQAFGKIPDKYIFGDILDIMREKKDPFKVMADSKAFDFYVDYLMKD